MNNLRWYDFGWCFMFADLISAGLFHSVWFLTLIGVAGYFAYERSLVYTRG